MKYIYIINGRPDKAQYYSEFYEQLKQEPHVYEVYTTLGEGDATRYVRLYCDLHPEEEVCFVACGGNGIINGVASGLVGYFEYVKESAANDGAVAAQSTMPKLRFTMAVLYFGGATQDFIINFPGRNFHSVKDMLAGTVTPIDVIKVNDSYCVNVCNIGFNARVASRANELVAKGKSAHQAYTRGVINAILTSRYNRIKVTVDGERIDGGLMILCTFANGRRVGGEFNCAPTAKVDDGLIDVCLFRAMTLLRFLTLVPLYRKGEHIGSLRGRGKIIFRQAREVVISSRDIIDIYIDGELLPGSRFEMKMLPGALPLRLPPVQESQS